MGKSKPTSSKKQPKRGPDFKKIKRKIGRKLPPPRNATNTQIKSKAIVLPEQSMASERAGMAVSKKGLTLRELLQQTSHHNAKIRKVALTGIRDLVLKYPSELKLHKLTIVEKLRERICDGDKVVRETLYHLLKTVIFPCAKQDITGPITSLMMAYVFSAMTHLAVDIRLMAFKFFELIVLSYPSSFFLYAEKVLDNYIDIFKSNQIYLQDKSKLKNALGGLVRCLSLLAKQRGEDDPSHDSRSIEERCLHAFEAELLEAHSDSFVMDKLEDLVAILINCFLESILLIRMLAVVDTLSSDCILYTLQCISLALKVYVDKMNKHFSSGRITSLSNGPDWVNAMLVRLKKLWEAFPIGELHHFGDKEKDIYFILNVKITEIFLHLSEWTGGSTVMVEKFLEFIESFLLAQVGSNTQFNKVFIERQLISLVLFIPGLVSKVTIDWKIRLLEAFTAAFRDCRVDSKLSFAFLSAIEEMLLPVKDHNVIAIESSFPDILAYWIAWIQELPKFLLQLGDKHPSISKAVLKLLLRIGQCSSPSSRVSLEYDHLQWSLKEFYGTQIVAGSAQPGSFVKLPSDCQELAIFCLYYFSNLSSDVLELLAFCCQCDNLEPRAKLQIIEVLHSAYKAGHVKISDHIGFLVTLVARFKVFPGKYCDEQKHGNATNQRIFQSIIRGVCSCLSQIGDKSLVLKLILKNISREVFEIMALTSESLKLPLENIRALLIVILTLYTRPTMFLEEDIQNISNWLSKYLIDAVSCIEEGADLTVHSDQIHIFQYYAHPCILLFCRSGKLLTYVLELLDSLIVEYEVSLASHYDVGCALEALIRVHKVISILTFMHNDVKLQRGLSSGKAAVHHVLQNMNKLLASSNFSMTLEERQKIIMAFDRLKASACKLHSWSESELKGI